VEARARQRCLSFCSRLFVRELDAAAWEQVESPLGRELLGLTVHEARSPAEPAAHDADFAHLTVVNLVPHGSFYMRDDARVEAGGANPVNDFYLAHGFEVDLGVARAIAGDHLGIELELLAHLAGHEADALQRGDQAYAVRVREVQRLFLEEHVLPWAPLYLFAVERCAHTPLYRAAARTTLQLLCGEHEALCADASPPPAGAPGG
jgi:TorA maturation chaperone TorD